MAYKTMLRQLISKWGIMSIDMQTAIDADMSVINEDGTKEYVDNVPDVIDAPSAEEVTKKEPESVQQALFG
jgi:recombination protein RecT